MKNRKTSVVLGVLAATVVLLASASDILGFSNGTGDGDKLPSGCTGCHSSPGSGAVAVAVSKQNVRAGDGLNVNVTVTEQALTGNGEAGVFLMKGPAGTDESITADGWTIVSDPNGNKHNYVERGSLANGVIAIFAWALTAPAAAGTFTLHAVVMHGGEGAVAESSAPLSITVTPAEQASAPPVIREPAFPESAGIGSALNISARITDDKEGVASASVHYRAPGGVDFTQSSMARTDGTSLDGNWSLGINAGLAPGVLEFYLTATDGVKTARSPASGTFAIPVVTPGAPEILAPSLPENAEPGAILNISARMTDGDSGVKLAAVRYRLPGDSDFTTKQMRLVNGTDKDGIWSADIGTGQLPGALELYLSATDGENEARAPATGAYTIQIIKPEGPALEISAPAAVTIGSKPEVRANASDPLGVVGVRVLFKRDDEAAYRVADMTLRSGNATSGEWGAVLPAAGAAGKYLFIVVARSPRSDSQSVERTIKLLPDLLVSGMTLSKKGMIVKQEVVISAVIENRGDRPVAGLSVHFLDRSYAVGDVQSIRHLNDVAVPANGKVTVKALWVPQVEGDREIAVVVDPDNRVEEGNEENNQISTTVPVGLEPGMGIRMPIPSLGEVWVQLAVIAGIAVVAGGIILHGRKDRKRPGASGPGSERGRGQTERPG
jgi:hypothetical protein